MRQCLRSLFIIIMSSCLLELISGDSLVAEEIAPKTTASDPTHTRIFSKNWSFDQSENYWSPGGSCTTSAVQGHLMVHSTGANPVICSPVFLCDVNFGQAVLTLRMKSHSKGPGQVTWRGGKYDFSDASGTLFTPIHDDGWHDYTIDIHVDGYLQGLRLVPSSDVGDMEIAEISLTVFAQIQPGLPISIQGTVFNHIGKPVNEAFLMLKNNPQLNALTTADGRFRIDGNAWELPDELLISATGSATEHVIVSSQLNNLQVHLHPADPLMTTLEMGMSLKTLWYPIYTASRPLTSDQKKCIGQFDQFLKDRGNAIIEKLLSGATLTDDEKPYEFILASEIMTKASDSPNFLESDPGRENHYCAEVKKKFYQVSLKAIEQKRLSESDVHDLRLMSAMYGGTGFDPMGWGYYRAIGVPYPPVTNGSPLPFDVPFLRTSPLVTSSNWTNYTSLSAATYLRLEGLWGYLDSFWKWQIKGECLRQSPPSEWRKHYWQPEYQVTSVNELSRASKGRPLYLCCSNFEDSTAFGFYTRQVEYFRRAYKGHADVYHVSQSTSDAFVDIFMDEWSFFGPNPGADPLKGFDCPRWEMRNFTPFRHARMDKLCAMHDPFQSGEILLDLPRDCSFLISQPEFHMQLMIDGKGNVAVPRPTAQLGGAGDWYAITTRRFSDYAAYCSYQRLGGESYWYSLINEQLLRDLIINGPFQAPNGSNPGTLNRVLVQYPRNFFTKDDAFTITSIDTAHRIIHAAWFDPGVQARSRNFGMGYPSWGTVAPKGDFEFLVQTDTRFVRRRVQGVLQSATYQNLDEDPAGTVYQLDNFEMLKPGDLFIPTISLPEPVLPDIPLGTCMDQPEFSWATPDIRNSRPHAFDMGNYSDKPLVLERVMNYSSHNCYAGLNPRFMPLYGTIVAKQGTLISVQIHQDEVRDMWGYRFWKEELNKGRSGSQLPTLFMPTIMRWADGSDLDRSYRFNIDGATDVFRDGKVSSASELEIGDFVFVEYEMWWENQGQQKDVIFPERIQASSPITSWQPK